MKFSTPSWTPDNYGFYYSRFPAPEEGKALTARNVDQKLYFHVLGTPQEEDVLAGEGDVFNYLDGAEYGAAHPAGDAYGLSLTVADGGYAVQSPLDPGAVVAAELAQPLDDAVQVIPGDFLVRQGNVAVREASLGQPPQIQHDLQKFLHVIPAI